MGDLTNDFSLREFRCKDGTPVPAQYLDNVKRLATNLQVLRDIVASPITIISGYRSPRHNDSVEGKKKSQHLCARAADVAVRGMRPAEVAKLIEELIANGQMEQGGLGRYAGWVHYDIRGYRARW